MAKIAFTGATTNYSFPIAGRRIFVAAADTALPSSITPLDSLTPPSGWTDLGPTENQEVTLNLTRQTEAIQVGVIPTDVRKYITGQSGSLEANLMRYEPAILGYQAGVDPETVVPAAGGDRSYVDIFLGGTLGSTISVLTFEDFDIDLDDDAGTSSYEQVWYYSPSAQSDGDINLSARITKANAVALRLTLLSFTNIAAGDRNLLLQQRWLLVA
jgi:hypothetical protein